ncbi:MAG: molybdenum cofactor guanylyltransferase [Acidobacteriota bacterium]
MEKNRNFPINNCTAIILAGGKSRRMSIDKKYLKIEGSFLLDRVISNVSKLFANVLISISDDVNYKHKNIKIVRDTFIGRGPLAGILSGLKNSSSERNFIIAGDIPEISIDLISELYSYAEKYEIVVPRSSEKKLEPLYGFYNKSIIPNLEESLLTGNNKVIEVYNHVSLKIVDMKKSAWFFNLNTESDLSGYLSYLKAK